MKVCIPKEGYLVSQHFGHVPEFAIFTIEDGKVITKEIIPSPGHEPGVLPRLLSSHGVTHVITGGMGKKAQDMFAELNIKVYPGVSGTIDGTIQKFIDGTLSFGPNVCDH
ncbi:dinitrogenase iron-molybdenum cofactor [Methanocella sp. CWC-04]|uniref:Dinitrogenase iron-molybdenum cofactor n=1 Tax=Methanooceanicella nereidis TaxID=2052831 RepID=A0AAP2RBD8_9EURY|nr:NifB/NifX family molybdenum-iron cluster-binding protein [Methanocella sp. CWC-04]MCD1294318.1 dinitrogenase iron-molybdenum cofactor [Methanocella sp. CWC-04]